jgi:hypothetical protein
MGHGRQEPDRHNVNIGVPKGRTGDRRRRTHPENNKGIKDRDAIRQLRLRKERTSGIIVRKTVDLEIEKQIVGSSVGLREVRGWTLRRGRTLPKLKKRRQKHSPRYHRIKMMVVHLDRVVPFQGTPRDERP